MEMKEKKQKEEKHEERDLQEKKQKENQRVLATKRLLGVALIKLLKERTIHEISVRELCEKAGVNRSTFYNHYKSQYELWEDMTRQFLGAFEEKLPSPSAGDLDSIQECLTALLAFFAKHRDFSILLLNNQIDQTFAGRVFALPKVRALLGTIITDGADPYESDAIISFVANGSYYLLLKWLKMEDRPDPGRQAEMMIRISKRMFI